MIKLKNENTLKRIMADLYSGHRGTCLTAYIQPSPSCNQAQLVNQIESVIHNAERLMKKNHTPESIDEFLKPVRRLAKDPGLLNSSGLGGWALFRSGSQFRLKKLGMRVEPLSVVSNSFHIKPLLKWWLSSEDYYVLQLDRRNASLYARTGNGLRLIDRLPLLGGPLFVWLEDWVRENMTNENSPLILAGETWAIKQFLANSGVTNIFPRAVSLGPSEITANQLLAAVEDKLIEEELDQRKSMVMDLQTASKAGRTSFSVHRIGELLAQRKLSRLYIAEDAHIWGVFDRKTGQIDQRNHQTDCRDDDILDDFAEMALSQKVDVVLLPQSEMPTGTKVAAILKNESERRARPIKTGRRPEHIAS